MNLFSVLLVFLSLATNLKAETLLRDPESFEMSLDSINTDEEFEAAIAKEVESGMVSADSSKSTTGVWSRYKNARRGYREYKQNTPKETRKKQLLALRKFRRQLRTDPTFKKELQTALTKASCYKDSTSMDCQKSLNQFVDDHVNGLKLFDGYKNRMTCFQDLFEYDDDVYSGHAVVVGISLSKDCTSPDPENEIYWSDIYFIGPGLNIAFKSTRLWLCTGKIRETRDGFLYGFETGAAAGGGISTGLYFGNPGACLSLSAYVGVGAYAAVGLANLE